MAFELSGINELISELERIGNNVERIKRYSLKKGGDIIKEGMKRRCPRSTREGRHLADNIITSDAEESDGKLYVDVGPKKGDNHEFFYGKFLEYGTVKMRAQPFAEPGFIEKRQDALDKIAQIIRGAIE